jgi:hypothetical protein
LASSSISLVSVSDRSRQRHSESSVIPAVLKTSSDSLINVKKPGFIYGRYTQKDLDYICILHKGFATLA